MTARSRAAPTQDAPVVRSETAAARVLAADPTPPQTERTAGPGVRHRNVFGSAKATHVLQAVCVRQHAGR